MRNVSNHFIKVNEPQRRGQIPICLFFLKFFLNNVDRVINKYGNFPENFIPLYHYLFIAMFLHMIVNVGHLLNNIKIHMFVVLFDGFWVLLVFLEIVKCDQNRCIYFCKYIMKPFRSIQADQENKEAFNWKFYVIFFENE